MKWLNELLGMGLSALGLDVNGRIGGSVQFFIYDVLKITVPALRIDLCHLLYSKLFSAGTEQTHFRSFPWDLGEHHLRSAGDSNPLLLLFLYSTVHPVFTSAGLPLGVTFSFLISSPMVDLGSLVLLISIFGARVAIIYVILGLVIAVIGGAIIEKLHMEKYIENFVLSAGSVDIDSPDLTIRERLIYAKEQMLDTFKKVFPYILIGVGIGALIHNWIPESWVETVLGSNNPFGVILATIVGIPMYADIFGTIPVAEALLSKGGATWHCAILYDGRHYLVPAVPYHAPQGCKTQTAGAVHLAFVRLALFLVGYLFNAFQFILI